jgi:LPXTG-motif cell wall-anchored protein
VADVEAKVKTAIGGDFNKGFGYGPFEVGKEDAFAGGTYSIRAATVKVAQEEGAEAAELSMIPYPEADEDYLCASTMDNVLNSDTSKYVLPMFIMPTMMNAYGGPDLMFICRLMNIDSKDDEDKLNNTPLDETEHKGFVIFFDPNINEPPQVDLETREDSGNIEAIANASDPTNDELTYSWECIDAVGSDCTAMLGDATASKVSFKNDGTASVSALPPGKSAGEVTTSEPASPVTLTVTVTDPAGATAQASTDVELVQKQLKKQEDLKSEEPAPATAPFFGGYLTGLGCSVNGGNTGGGDMAQIILMLGMLLIALGTFVLRRRILSRIQIHERPRKEWWK